VEMLGIIFAWLVMSLIIGSSAALFWFSQR
jgi:hypothetical protein